MELVSNGISTLASKQVSMPLSEVKKVVCSEQMFNGSRERTSVTK